MAIFVTSDTHFSHANILRPDFCGEVRPFATAREMGDEIIRRWNARIGKDDTVYHLGDVFWNTPSAPRQRIFNKLHGRKHLVLGNHDDEKAMRRLDWRSISRSLLLADAEIVVMMTHYPPSRRDHDYACQRYGKVLWLHGHIHSMTPPSPPVMDVGVDAHGLKPWNLKDLLKQAREYFDRHDAGKNRLNELAQ